MNRKKNNFPKKKKNFVNCALVESKYFTNFRLRALASWKWVGIFEGGIKFNFEKIS